MYDLAESAMQTAYSRGALDAETGTDLDPSRPAVDAMILDDIKNQIRGAWRAAKRPRQPGSAAKPRAKKLRKSRAQTSSSRSGTAGGLSPTSSSQARDRQTGRASRHGGSLGGKTTSNG
jgi:hypothetical protein